MSQPDAKEFFQVLRSRAREAAMQVLYQDDLNPAISPAVGESLLGESFPMSEIEQVDRRELARIVREAIPRRSSIEVAAMEPGQLAAEVRADALQFARHLVAGVRRERAELDRRIALGAEHRSLERMAVTDRNVLRIGAYELLYTGAPPRVAIDEAVDLAKRYGSAQSGPFVNGILDKLMHEKQAKAKPE
jgi:transcription antitermination protein NusB